MFPFCTPLFVPTVNVSLILLFVVYSVYTFSIMLSGREKGGGRERVCVCVREREMEKDSNERQQVKRERGGGKRRVSFSIGT